MKLTSSIVFALLLSACSGGGGGSGGNDSKSPELPQQTFVDETERLAGEDAIDCGELAIGADPTAINECVADAFYAYQSFYAIYHYQGIDSNVATGFAYDGSTLYFVMYDDFSCPAAGDCASYYRVLECESPVVNDPGSEEAMKGNPFSCSDLVEVPTGG